MRSLLTINEDLELDLNGTPLAKSPELDLLAYDHEMELDDGSTKKVSVNEFQILVNRKKTPHT